MRRTPRTQSAFLTVSISRQSIVTVENRYDCTILVRGTPVSVRPVNQETLDVEDLEQLLCEPPEGG